jgi:pimeloyl-ACP methyl ester carboxylesterase
MSDPAPVTPQWLAEALAARPDAFDVEVEGVLIRYYAWGPVGSPGVVLVHGGLAHAHWWDHIAPLLNGHRVLAIDLSGHGESGHRQKYDAHGWGREILAVASDAGLRRPILIGHSMGGQAVVAAGRDNPDLVAGVVTIDTRFNDDPYTPRNKPSARFGSVEDAVAQFAPAHADPNGGPPTPPDLLRHIALASLTEEGNAWRWKRDDRYAISHVSLRGMLPELTVPLSVIRTQHGLVTPAMAAEMRALVPAPIMQAEIPAAAHNPMLEQPLALISALRMLLETWPHDEKAKFHESH